MELVLREGGRAPSVRDQTWSPVPWEALSYAYGGKSHDPKSPFTKNWGAVRGAPQAEEEAPPPGSMVARSRMGRQQEGRVLEAEPMGTQRRGKGGVLGLRPEQQWTCSRKVVVTAWTVPSKWGAGGSQKGPGVPQGSPAARAPLGSPSRAPISHWLTLDEHVPLWASVALSEAQLTGLLARCPSASSRLTCLRRPLLGARSTLSWGCRDPKVSGEGSREGPRRTTEALAEFCRAPLPDQHAQGRLGHKRSAGSPRQPEEQRPPLSRG
uniref:epidermal growth factor-like protein 7 isoform X3 n=1 Tax=Halichoerus grypus TaxID=9711 RepID=UPI001658D93E|nr:epidermal growth factor-like protein 7 isoform X3 [Halichoerus grypus]